MMVVNIYYQLPLLLKSWAPTLSVTKWSLTTYQTPCYLYHQLLLLLLCICDDRLRYIHDHFDSIVAIC